jgi:uncharacterized protein YceK
MRVIVMALIVVSGCASAADRYRDASKACVDQYTTRTEMDACRAGVRARFGVPAPSATRDAGAP